MNYKITKKYGHYEVYIDGRFYCSADTILEAIHEVETYKEEANIYEA